MTLVEQNLRAYIPGIVELINGCDFPWSSINSKFNRALDSRINNSKDEFIIVEASIYDVIIAVISGKSEYVGLLIYFNRLFDDLNQNLSINERILVISGVKNLLLTFNKNYLNFIGELSVLNQLKKSGNFNLIKYEHELPNGKSIDFDLEIINPNMRILIEVMNIHINNIRVVNDDNEIQSFFVKRIKDKIKSKKKGLLEDVNIHFLPIVWGALDQLKIYQFFFNNNSLNLNLVYEPLSYVSLTDHNGNYEFKFTPLSKLSI